MSRRDLVIAGDAGDAVLLEHPRAAQLPELLAAAPSPGELARQLGAPRGTELVTELLEAGLLTDTEPSPPPSSAPSPPAAPPEPRPERPVVVTRSGLEFAGIAHPARWIEAHLGWLWRSWPGRALLATITVAGVAAMLAGRPAGPTVSDRPWLDALLGLVIGWSAGALHELAHAVALVGYGRRPRRAGFGFYWGGISFYVDSTEALTLPRRARVTQALVGLGVDVITTSVLAVIAQLAEPTLLHAVAWRVAVLAVLGIVMNLLPILQVDGHWALADYLDEPDLAPRSRAALTAWLRRRPLPGPRWLAGYGAVSLLGGLAALTVAGFVWWSAAGDLATALFTGNPAEILIGLVLVGPVTASLALSLLGLLLDLVPEAGGVHDNTPVSAPGP